MCKIKFIFTEYNNNILCAVFKEDVLYELSVENDEDIIGSVYLCRVSKKINNIDGCIIQYKPKCNGFFKSNKIKCETILPLQLKKEGTHSKEPLFTDKITLTSNYAVISRSNPDVLFSSKLDKEYKDKYYKEYLNLSNDLAIKIIIRTNAYYVSFEKVVDDIKQLSKKLSDIEHNASNRTLYSLLYKPNPTYIDKINNLLINNEIEIVTDIDSIYSKLSENYLSTPNNIKIKYYEDDMLSLFHLYKMEHHLKNATSRTVPLKSGGTIVIDQTEALVTIDVNTHFSSSKEDMENTFFETNVEASHEIIRQIIIRNLSGMIIIDFIKMKDSNHYDELLNLLKRLSKDATNDLKIIDLTGLKLVEMVRTKRRKTLAEQIKG